MLLSALACSRWRPNTPIEFSAATHDRVFERVVAVVREMGYPVVEQDEPHGYLRVSAKTISTTATPAGRVTDPGSWFTIQIAAPDRVTLQAFGYLVRDNETVRRNALDDELTELASRLRARLER